MSGCNDPLRVNDGAPAPVLSPILQYFNLPRPRVWLSDVAADNSLLARMMNFVLSATSTFWKIYAKKEVVTELQQRENLSEIDKIALSYDDAPSNFQRSIDIQIQINFPIGLIWRGFFLMPNVSLNLYW